MKEYYIDLGSSTVKVYEYVNSLSLLEEHSIYFKNGFTKENGISTENSEELYTYFHTLVEKYDMKYENTNIYATGIFRNLSHEQRVSLVREFNARFDLHFTIISHGIENYYLGKAMENDYNNKKVMIINMGGKTTELITFENNKITNRMNLNVGVGDILQVFPEVNESYAGVTVEKICDFVKDILKDITFDTDYDCAVFTGGEERFEKLTGYHLVANTLFTDGIHKYMVSYDDYVRDTNHVFHEMTLSELHDLMPQNPKWMDGARAGAVLPLAIFDMAKIQYIIPSDLNLINGVMNDLDQ